MSYETKNIRNVCLLGHGGSGKTTLAESMLYMTGAIDRQGKTADGNTVCDYDPEEIKRQITISTSIAPVNFGGCKINVLDCPGFFDFAGDEGKVYGKTFSIKGYVNFCESDPTTDSDYNENLISEDTKKKAFEIQIINPQTYNK